MRTTKFVVGFVIVLLAFSSIAVVAQSDYTINSNTKMKEATETFSISPVNSGGEPQFIRGIEFHRSGTGYWLVYNHNTDTNDFSIEGQARDFIENEPRENNPQPMVDLSGEALVYDVGFAVFPRYDSNAIQYVYNGSYFYGFPVDVGGFGLVQDGDGTVELYSSEWDASQSKFTVFDNDANNEIPWIDQIKHNGTVKVIYGVGTDSGTETRMINSRTGETTILDGDYTFTSGYVQATKLNETYVAYSRPPNDDSGFNSFQYLSVANLSGGSFSSGTVSYGEMGILANNKTHIAVVPQEGNGFNNSVLIYNKEKFIKYLIDTPNKYSYDSDIQFINNASRKIPYPQNVSQFDKGFQIEDKWFLYDTPNSTFYVYDNLNELSSVVNVSIKDERFGVTKYRTFDPFLKNGTIYFGTYKGPNILKVFNSHVPITETQTGCMQYLMPSQLDMLPMAPNVCWIPMFTGIGILNTEFQWFILALLIAMPIAKQTRSDIATMATINGVLFVAMALDRLSPAIMAISLVTTILLSVYGTRGSDVSVNVGGGDEI